MRVLRIADARIGVTPDSPDVRIGLGGAHVHFVAEDDALDVELRAGWDTLAPGSIGEPVFDAGGAWKLSRVTEGFLFRFFTPLRGPTPYKELRVSKDFSQGRVALHREFYRMDEPVSPLDYPLDELLLVHYLSQREGVIVHACGLVDEDGAGYLFIGHSGAGKTTTALLWENRRGVRILSDDRIVLRRHNGQIVMHGTPWHGTGRLSAPGSAEVSGIFFLEHGSAPALRPISGAQVVADLVARSFLAFHDRVGIASVMALLDDCARNVPCVRLAFRPDETAVDAVRAWKRGAASA